MFSLAGKVALVTGAGSINGIGVAYQTVPSPFIRFIAISYSFTGEGCLVSATVSKKGLVVWVNVKRLR